MKIKLFQINAVCNLLSSLKVSDLGDKALEDKVVQFYLSLLPHNNEFALSLAQLQKDAQGKSEPEVAELLSAKAFNETANKDVEIEGGFTFDEIKALGGKIKDFTLKDYQVLMAVVKT